MGLIDKFKKKTANDSADNSKIIAEIFRTICKDKENIAAQIAECTSSPKDYAVKNAAPYSERGISPDDTDTDTLMWIGCVDILINNAYAAELDFSCELEDLIFNLGKLDSVADENVNFDENDLSADDDITIWLDKLDEQLKDRKLCIGGIDIDSDSYVIFLTDIQTLEKLKDSAGSIGHRIDFAKNL
ncbi:DUF6630 family protein [Ruminococcus albus]|uniref:DUF6630 domain-containing protein n=1 Tax=Ruminococcus albus TaxID=1264 RepID=A0A1I1D138_RUMAL|nr:DUF6630 family protein [Ruminococcus albus]SFB68072.1 hypothetical protein SAMN02910406_00220 [Ruminococcus albus]